MAEDTKAAQHVTDHLFRPKREWWSLCRHCNLAESAHRTTALKPEDRRA